MNENGISANTDESSEPMSKKHSLEVGFFSLCVFALVLMLFALYVAFVVMQTEAPVENLPTEEEQVQTEVVNLNELAAERLAAIDAGQGIVSMRVVEDKEMYLITTPADIPSILGATERALYQKINGFCEDECLDTWTPYTTDIAYEGERLRTVLVDEASQMHYVLLDGKMLFTFTEDFSIDDTNGDGFNGEWELVRP